MYAHYSAHPRACINYHIVESTETSRYKSDNLWVRYFLPPDNKNYAGTGAKAEIHSMIISVHEIHKNIACWSNKVVFIPITNYNTYKYYGFCGPLPSQ